MFKDCLLVNVAGLGRFADLHAFSHLPVSVAEGYECSRNTISNFGQTLEVRYGLGINMRASNGIL